MRAWKSASWLCAAWLLLAAAGAAQADQMPCGQARNVAAGGLDEPTWRRLNAIHAAVGEERYDEAYEELNHMLQQARRDAYLQAVINQALGQVEWERGRLEAALGFFETALELDALPDSVHYALLYQVAQLYYTIGRLDEALERLDGWFCSQLPVQRKPIRCPAGRRGTRPPGGWTSRPGGDSTPSTQWSARSGTKRPTKS